MTQRICAAIVAIQILAATPPLFAENATEPRSQNRAANSSRELTIRGIVRDRDGLPIGGATIGAVALSHRPKSDPLTGTTIANQVGQTTSAADGRFEFRVRSMTRDDIALELSARAPGQGIALADLPVGNAPPDISLTLSNEIPVRITVLAPDGQPLPLAVLRPCGLLPVASGSDVPQWYSAPLSGVASWPPSNVTGVDGSCTIPTGSTVSKMQLEIDDPRVARQRFIVAVQAAKSPIVLNTLPARSAEGQVVVSDSRHPIAGVDVSITSWDDGEYVGAVTKKTDAEGNFSLPVYAGNSLTIRARLPDSKFQILSRAIPWIERTTRQRMVLPLYRSGQEPQDGTTPDGRLATTIDHEVPSAVVTTHRPEQPISSRLSGVLVASEIPLDGEQTRPRIVAIDPESGKSRVLVENALDGRASPDGQQILYGNDSRSEFRVVAADAAATSRVVAKKPAGTACWLDDRSVVANINDPAPRDYFGQIYWPLEITKRRFSIRGEDLGQIDVPPPYRAFDVSRDRKLLVMHWDTHASATGAQLFVAGTDGSNLRPIARRRSEYYWYPRFSPDDKYVLAKHLDANKTGKLTIRIIALDGSQERAIQLSDDVGPEVACWSPDGAWIAIVAYDQAAFSGGRKVSHIFVASSSGDQIREVATDDRSERHITSIDWSAARAPLGDSGLNPATDEAQ